MAVKVHTGLARLHFDADGSCHVVVEPDVLPAMVAEPFDPVAHHAAAEHLRSTVLVLIIEDGDRVTRVRVPAEVVDSFRPVTP
jgi:hypothetical protein